MRKLWLSAIAGAAMACVSLGSASSATCTGSLANTCSVTDGVNTATEGSPAVVTLTFLNDVTISEVFASSLDGAFTTTGDFLVDFGIPGGLAQIAVSTGSAFFSPLLLSFNGALPTDISNGGTFVFSLLAGVSNTFSITGNVTTNGVKGSYDIAISAVPLPPALLLFGTALAGMGLLRRKRSAA